MKYKLIGGILFTGLLFSLFFSEGITAFAKTSDSLVVNTRKELREALKNKGLHKLTIKSNKKINIGLRGNYENLEIVFDTPQAKITNKASFKKITFKGRYLREISNNNIVVTSNLATVLVDKRATLKELKLSRIGSDFKLVANGKIYNLIIDKRAKLDIEGSGRIDNIKVLSRYAELSSKLPTALEIMNDAKLSFWQGAEGIKISQRSADIVLDITNDTDKDIEVSLPDGNKRIVIARRGLTAKNTEDNQEKNLATIPPIVPAIPVPVVPINTTPVVPHDNSNTEKAEESTYVNIEDEKLRYLINKNIDVNRTGTEEITEEEISKLTALSTKAYNGEAYFDKISVDGVVEARPILAEIELANDEAFSKYDTSYGIRSLKGLEKAINLTRLQLDNNEIRDLTPISNLTKLTYLNLRNNRVSGIEPLKNLVNLVELDLYKNQLTDIKPLSTLTKLEVLRLGFNSNITLDNNKVGGIKDISPIVDNLRELRELDLSENVIESVKGIENLTKLTNLNLLKNEIRDYENAQSFLMSLHEKQKTGEATVNFTDQHINFEKSIIVKDSTVSFDSTFRGIQGMTEQMKEILGLKDSHLFEMISSNVGDMGIKFNEENNELSVRFEEDYISANNNREISVNFTLGNDSIGFWHLKNIRFKFEIPENI